MRSRVVALALAALSGSAVLLPADTAGAEGAQARVWDIEYQEQYGNYQTPGAPLTNVDIVLSKDVNGQWSVYAQYRVGAAPAGTVTSTIAKTPIDSSAVHVSQNGNAVSLDTVTLDYASDVPAASGWTTVSGGWQSVNTTKSDCADVGKGESLATAQVSLFGVQRAFSGPFTGIGCVFPSITSLQGQAQPI